MKRFSGFILVAVVAMLMQGCLGSGGSSASPPNNVVATAKDSRVVVTWDMVPGVEYWIWKAAGTGVTTQNCSSMALCTTTLNATSPASISGLVNGTTYSFTINGRINGGPGGTGSPAVAATPRLAGTGLLGATWSTGSPLGPTPGTTLRGVTSGTVSSINTFVAVGDSGVSYSSTDGKNWATLTTLPGTNFNAVSYDSIHAKYISVGVTGTTGTVAALSTPVTSSTLWVTQPNNTLNPLFAVANNGAGLSVATGASGTVATSSDGATWTSRTSGTSYPLNSVTYGSGIFVAVGASGTILHSADGGVTYPWVPASSPSTTSNIIGVTYGLAYSIGTFVAVTSDGKVITSTNGDTWTTPVPVSTTLNAVTASLNAITSSFVAVDAAGNIFLSTDGGITWPQVNTGTGTLYAVTRGGLLDYSAVGITGLNLYAD